MGAQGWSPCLPTPRETPSPCNTHTSHRSAHRQACNTQLQSTQQAHTAHSPLSHHPSAPPSVSAPAPHARTYPSTQAALCGAACTAAASRPSRSGTHGDHDAQRRRAGLRPQHWAWRKVGHRGRLDGSVIYTCGRGRDSGMRLAPGPSRLCCVRYFRATYMHTAHADAWAWAGQRRASW